MSHYEPTNKSVRKTPVRTTKSNKKYIIFPWAPRMPVVLTKQQRLSLENLDPPLNFYDYAIPDFLHEEVIDLAIICNADRFFTNFGFSQKRTVDLHSYVAWVLHPAYKKTLCNIELTFSNIINSVPAWRPIFRVSRPDLHVEYFLRKATGVDVKPSHQFLRLQRSVRSQVKINLMQEDASKEMINELEFKNSYRDKALLRYFNNKPLIFKTDTSLSILLMGCELNVSLSYVISEPTVHGDRCKYMLSLAVSLTKDSDFMERSGINAQFDLLHRECSLPSDIVLLIIEQQFACRSEVVEPFMMFCVAYQQDFCLNSNMMRLCETHLDYIPRLHTTLMDANHPVFGASTVICCQLLYYIAMLLDHALMARMLKALSQSVPPSFGFQHFLPYDEISSETILNLKSPRYGPANEGALITLPSFITELSNPSILTLLY